MLQYIKMLGIALFIMAIAFKRPLHDLVFLTHAL